MNDNHWYASVSSKATVARVTPEFVRQQRDQQLFSALACSIVDEHYRADDLEIKPTPLATG